MLKTSRQPVFFFWPLVLPSMHCTSVVIPIKKTSPLMSLCCNHGFRSSSSMEQRNAAPRCSLDMGRGCPVVGKMSAWFAMIYVWRDCGWAYSHPWFNGCYILEWFLIMHIACFSKALTPQNHSETKTPPFKNKRITFNRGTSQPTKNTAWVLWSYLLGCLT
jgi:hypothetical protein